MEMSSRLANRRETSVETALRPIDRPMDLAVKSPLMPRAYLAHISLSLSLSPSCCFIVELKDASVAITGQLPTFA